TRAPFHDLPRNGGCGHGVRRCEVELPRSGTTGKVPVDRGDRDLVLRARHARARVDARAAGWLDERRAHVGENPVVTLLLAVLEDFARPALDEAAYVLRYVLVPLQRFPEDTGVHVHVLLLAGRARAGVRNVDRDLVGQLVHRDAVARIAGQREHWPERCGVDLDDLDVPGAGIRCQAIAQRARGLVGDAALRDQIFDRALIRRDDAGEGAHLGRHVGHRRAFVHRERLHRLAGVLDDLPDRRAALDVWMTKDLEHEVLGGDVVRLRAVHD